MRESYRDSAGKLLAAKKLQGEVELMLFYRTLISRLLIILFLVSLSSMSTLLLVREIVIAIESEVVNIPMLATFTIILSVTVFGLYFFLREDVFLSRVLRKTYKLKNTAPSTYGFNASDSTTT